MYANIFESIGNNGPYIMIFTSFGLLFSKPRMLFYFVVGVFFNFIVNMILKGVIKQPRPEFNTKAFNIALHTNSMRYIFGYDIYGMPSSHAQMAFFTSVFIYLSIKHTNFLYLYIIISLFICYQRIKIQYHSISQIVVGAIVGSGFGYLVYQLAREKIKGRIREKPDDDGPI